MQDGKHIILLVDDDPDILESLRIVLDANDYFVLTASSGQEGLKIYREQRPDLLIVDLMMEEIDSGTSFVKDLQAIGNTAPVYLLSSAGDSLYSTVDASALGLTGVFQKPINTEMLLALLKAKLG